LHEQKDVYLKKKARQKRTFLTIPKITIGQFQIFQK